MGFRNPITSVTAVDTGGGLVPGVKIYSQGANPATGVVEWDAFDAVARGTLTSSQTGSGGTYFALALSGGPSLQLNIEELPGGGGYAPAIRLSGAPLTVDGIAGLAYARLIATGNAPLSGTYSGWTTVPFGAAPLDSHGGFAGAGKTRWTVPAGQDGIYDIVGQVVFTADSTNPVRNARLLINGAVFPGCAGTGGQLGTSSGVSATTGVKAVSLVAGQYVELQGFSSTGWVSTTFADAASNLEIVRVR